MTPIEYQLQDIERRVGKLERELRETESKLIEVRNQSTDNLATALIAIAISFDLLLFIVALRR